jgi:hypothetical protein
VHRGEACSVIHTESVPDGRRLRMACHPGNPFGTGPGRSAGTRPPLRRPTPRLPR